MVCNGGRHGAGNHIVSSSQEERDADAASFTPHSVLDPRAGKGAAGISG